MRHIKQNLSSIKQILVYPTIHVLESSPETECIVDGKRVLLFGSNNYLGLSTHPKVKEAAKKAIDYYGVGSGGSRILSGNMKIHQELEETIAQFKKKEDSIVYSAGYQTNIGFITAYANLFGAKALGIQNKIELFGDELNHASIIDGCKYSKATLNVYGHKNTDQLLGQLADSKADRKLVVTDGVFSMDGDLAPLDKLVEAKRKHNATIMVDDAHGTGVLGEYGHGIAEYYDCENDVDIIMGTFSKALGSAGGFIAGERDLVEFLRIASRSYMFSAGISPVIAAAVKAGFMIIESEPELRRSLWDNARYMRKSFQQAGFNVVDSEDPKIPIIPIIVGDEQKCISIVDKLFEKGIYVHCSRWPAVPKGLSRIRFSVMATHTREQIDKAIEAMQLLMK